MLYCIFVLLFILICVFVAFLKVNSSGFAFHSKYIAEVGPKLKVKLEKILANPKKRTSRWISSSIPENSNNIALAEYSSAAYHVNNLLSPVLFHEAIQKVPENAVVIEIAPTCLLQAILRRSLPPTVTHVSLHKRDHVDNMSYLLSNLGKLYMAGGQPRLSKLYPPISFPVGKGTPMLNSAIGWDHKTKWGVANWGEKQQNSGANVVEVDLTKETDAFLSGHAIG